LTSISYFHTTSEAARWRSTVNGDTSRQLEGSHFDCYRIEALELIATK